MLDLTPKIFKHTGETAASVPQTNPRNNLISNSMQLIKKYLFVKFLKISLTSYIVFLSCLICPAISRTSYLLSSSHITLAELYYTIIAELVITALNITPVISVVSTFILASQLSRDGELSLIRILGVGSIKLSTMFLTFGIIPYAITTFFSYNIMAKMHLNKAESMDKIQNNAAISIIEEKKVLESKSITMYINKMDVEHESLHGVFIVHRPQYSSKEMSIVGRTGNIKVSERSVKLQLNDTLLSASDKHNPHQNYSILESRIKEYHGTIPFAEKTHQPPQYNNMPFADLFYRLLDSMQNSHTEESFESIFGEITRRVIFPIYTLIGVFGAMVAMSSFPLSSRGSSNKPIACISAIIAYIITSSVISTNTFPSLILNIGIIANIILIFLGLFLITYIRNSPFE